MTMSIAAVIGQFLTFLTVVLGFVYQYVRDARQHKWDREDRRDIAAQSLVTQRLTATRLAIATAEAEARLTAQIENNTEVSRVAFKEANDVNMKIHALGLDARIAKAKHEADDDGA